MPSKIVGRRCKIMNCCGRENSPRTSITMNSPASCAGSAMRFATWRAVIFKSRAFRKRSANAFPNGMRKLTRHWQTAGRQTGIGGRKLQGVARSTGGRDARQKTQGFEPGEQLRMLWDSQLSESRTRRLAPASEHSEKAAGNRMSVARPSNGRRIICLTAIRSCWNASCGSRHWNGDAVKISPWLNSKNSRASVLIFAIPGASG
jgi:hypothetical protein